MLKKILFFVIEKMLILNSECNYNNKFEVCVQDTLVLHYNEYYLVL